MSVSYFRRNLSGGASDPPSATLLTSTNNIRDETIKQLVYSEATSNYTVIIVLCIWIFLIIYVLIYVKRTIKKQSDNTGSQ